MLTLGSTPIASTYYLVKVGGDIAVLKGMMKSLVALDAKSLAEGGPVFSTVISYRGSYNRHRRASRRSRRDLLGRD